MRVYPRFSNPPAAAVCLLLIYTLCLPLIAPFALRSVQASTPAKASGLPPATIEQPQHKGGRREGELIVRFREGVTEQEKDTIAASKQVRRSKKLRGNSGIEKLQLQNGQTPEDVMAELRQTPLVEMVEPNYLITRDELLPNDARFNEQWALRNTGSTGGLPNSDIAAPMAWETTTGAPETLIAVIDSGIDFTHPDLVNNQWTNNRERANSRDDDHNGFTNDLHGWDWITDGGTIRDEQGHGTMVAGVIAAEGNNGTGATGVMWRASLMSLRVLDANGIGDVADAVEAIDYAAAKGAQVINCSWGTSEESLILRDAIERAGSNGALVVVSAGNNGRDIESVPYYPASFGLPNVVAVAATNGFDQLASWSNYGATHVAVAAPGTDILTTEMGGGYRLVTGTSVSTPFVSGIAGLIKTARPWLTPNGTAAAIKDGARHVAELTGKVSTNGVASAYGALSALQGQNGGNTGGGNNDGGGNGGGNNGVGNGNGNGNSQGHGQTPAFTPPGGGGSTASAPMPVTPGTPGPNLPNLDQIRTIQPAAPRATAPIQADACASCDPGGGDPTPDPGSPNDPYFGTARTRPQNETGQPGIDLGSRNFNWSTALLGMKGRGGLDLSLSLYYNSLIWTKQGNAIMFNADRGTPAPGFNLGFPTLEAQYMDADENYTSYLLVLPSGARIQLKPTGTANVFESSEGSYIQLTANGTNTGGTARTSDGTQYKFVMQSGGRMSCTEIKDRNGNFITLNYDVITGRLKTVIDTLNHIVNFNYDANNFLISITQTRNGAEFPWATFSYSPKTLNTNFPGMSYRGPANPNLMLLTYVGLSDGTSYRFDYTTWGQIYYIAHHGTDSHLLNYSKYNLPLTNSVPHSDSPRFTERRDWAEYWNGDTNGVPASSEEAVTTYSVDPNSASGEQPAWSRMTMPDGTVYKEYFATTGWQKGLTTETKNFASAADEQADTEQAPRWKKKTVTAWTHDGTGVDYPINARPAETNIYDSDGNRRRTVIEYAMYSLPQSVKEYGGANGATLLRETYTAYLIYQYEYTSRRILNLVQYREVRNGAGQVVAKEDFMYDLGDTHMSGTGGTPVQHDEQNYGTSFVTGRGNPGWVRRWDVTQLGDVTQARGQAIGYNTTGEVTFTRDARGHSTSISYTDSFSDGANRNTYAFPTTVTDPDGNVSKMRYDYNLGAVTYTEGPPPAGQTQGAVAEMEYDSAGRLLKATNKVNNAFTRYVYGSYYVQSFSSVNTVADDSYAIELFDGAGRVRATAAYHPGSAGGYTAQYTKFDVMGRVVQQSNPAEIDVNWNAVGDDAAGWIWTQQAYDWKGRPITTTNPDGSLRLTSYGGCGCAGGEVVTVKDEAGRGRRLTHDVLGRLRQVEELRTDGSLYATTNYTYNERDQLTLIDQQGQQRSFEYDGYGRLAARVTPEQGRTAYDYYTDDTVKTITDARGASATYAYNNRHLVTGITYVSPSGVVEPTANVSFGYDAAGNRTSMTDGLGQVGYQYDRLSQLKSETRTFNSGALNGSSFALSYDYNLAGELTKVTNPWNVQVGYQYDRQGRVSGVTGANYGGVSSYINSIGYRAFGGTKAIAYGNGKSLSMNYDNRLRMTKWDLAGILGYDYAYNSYAENTGRVTYADSIYDPTLDRSYVYDFVGRLSLAYTGSEARATIGTDTWGHPDGPYAQGFDYDQRG
ncbi:MAG TPA: S8 family serine peptidase, partial [Pyrinomonadaceae bacterium]|nr:S8 family serine peptidase [Pyrinomonadaceae bacterium]